jgi:hypothetical protein
LKISKDYQTSDLHIVPRRSSGEQGGGWQPNKGNNLATYWYTHVHTVGTTNLDPIKIVAKTPILVDGWAGNGCFLHWNYWSRGLRRGLRVRQARRSRSYRRRWGVVDVIVGVFRYRAFNFRRLLAHFPVASSRSDECCMHFLGSDSVVSVCCPAPVHDANVLCRRPWRRPRHLTVFNSPDGLRRNMSLAMN